MLNEDTELFRQTISRLQTEENKSPVLNEIKNLLIYKTAPEACSCIRNVGISKIVDCFCLTDKNEIDLVCEVLRLCFEKFEPGEFIKKYLSHIMFLLRHDKVCARRLAIDEIYKAITTKADVFPVPEFIDVLVAVAQLVGDKDVGVANKAILVASNLPSEAYPKVLEEMKIALEYDTSSKCNVFEVIVNISTKSYELFTLSAETGYIDIMVQELQTSDVLYQLNILELLSRLAVKPYGINHLVKNGTLKNIADLIGDVQANPLGGLMIPGYMKFFGNIAHHYPKDIFEKYPVLLDSLFDAFESGDPALLPIALDTLGFVGITSEGKLCLVALGSKYTQTVEKIGRLIKNSPTEIKIRALHCFANLIKIDQDPSSAPKTGPVDHRITLMTREWFRSLSDRPSSMEVLYELCKNPFPDIRLAAFVLLDAVCQHQWGEELVARTAGFIEYLLDRSQDYTKESKEAKYDIIKRLSNSPAFDSSISSRLKTYTEEGPFFSETVMEVAMNDAD